MLIKADVEVQLEQRSRYNRQEWREREREREDLAKQIGCLHQESVAQNIQIDNPTCKCTYEDHERTMYVRIG